VAKRRGERGRESIFCTNTMARVTPPLQFSWAAEKNMNKRRKTEGVSPISGSMTN